MSEKKGYIREDKNAITPRRKNLCTRAVTAPDEKLSSSTEVKGALSSMQINGSDLNLNTEDLEEGLRNKESEDREIDGLVKAKEYSVYARNPNNPLESIEKILNNKEDYCTL